MPSASRWGKSTIVWSTRTSRWLMLSSTEFPTMLVSYEKAVLRGARFVRALAEFVGIDHEGVAERAVEAVEIERPEYLEHARATKISLEDRSPGLQFTLTEGMTYSLIAANGQGEEVI